MEKIKKKDHVIVIAGKDKGKKGEVIKVLYDMVFVNKNKQRKIAVKAIVQGINLFKKNKKPDPAKNITGGIISKEMPIAISNVALINPITNKAGKVGFKYINQIQDENQTVGVSSGKVKNHKKVRYFKASQEVIDV